MRANSVVESLVRAELGFHNHSGDDRPHGHGPGEALCISLDCRMADFETDEHLARGLHLIFYAPNTNAISSFSGVSDSPFDAPTQVRLWTHECTHDSCWHDIQAYSKLYFELADNLNMVRLDKGWSERAPRDFYQATFFRFSEHIYSWVPVKVTIDPEDPNRHRRLLKLL